MYLCFFRSLKGIMPVFKVVNLLETQVVLWELTESDYDIALALECTHALVNNEFNAKYLRNTYGWQFALKNFLENEYFGIYKDDHGKPFLLHSMQQIAVAHTKQMIALAIHPDKSVGIDIETCSEKIERVKHKFMSAQELQNHDSNEDLTRIWCAKEAVYKLNGKKGVSLQNDISVLMTGNDSGEIHLCQQYLANYTSFLINDLMVVLAVKA